MTKLLWRQQHTRQVAFRNGTALSPNCPLCQREDSSIHFLQCREVRVHRRSIQQFSILKQKLAALDISAMMWHIICGYIEGGHLPLSGEEELDPLLLEIYEAQNALSPEQFLFGRLLGNFFPVAQYQKVSFEESSYPKIWSLILTYVCEIWRIRGELVSMKLQSSQKFTALREAELLLDSKDISYVSSGDKSLFEKCPDTSWPLSRIQSWLKTARTCIEKGKRFAFKNQPRITFFVQNK